MPVSRKCGSHLGERRHTLLQHLHAVPLYRYGPLTHCDVSEGLYVESSTRPEDHFPDLIRPFEGFMKRKPPFVPRRAVDAAHRAVKLRCGGFVFRNATTRTPEAVARVGELIRVMRAEGAPA